MSCCNSSSSSESKRCVCSRAICDGALLFLARSLRLAAYGWAGVALYKYLAVIGLSNGDVGLLLTLILVGDLLMSLLVTTRADRCGRRASLVLGTLLMIGAGIAFAFSTNLYVLAVAGVVGVISPTGGEIGPFLAVEQAALTQLVETGKITTVFAVYNLVGSLSIAAGALIGGAAIDWLLANAFATADAYRAALIAYSVLACSMVVAYALLSKRVEPPPTAPELDVLRDSATPPGKSGHWFCFQGGMACARPTVASVTGLKARSTQIVVAKMCALFIIDACGAGFVMQSMISFWLNERWAVDATLIGVVLMSCNIAAGVSALLAAPLAKKIGLVNTMVFTHIPSNLFLVAVPLMPSAVLAMACIVGRFTISQMDVPARQAFVVLVVPADERAAASGITTVTRSIGLAISPLISGVFLAHTENSYLFGASFFCGAGLMMLYDVLLWFALRRVQVAGETTRTITTTVNDVEELPTDDGVPSIHASQRSDLKNFLE